MSTEMATGKATTESGAGKTAEETAAAAAAAAAGGKGDGQTPEQVAAAAKDVADKKAADDKAAADKKTADDKAAADAAAAAGKKAPDKYALKVPEKGVVDDSDVKAIETFARANNYTNEEAQALLESHDAELQARSVQFLEATKADKDYGGDKLEETQTLARTALERLRPKGTPRGDALRKLLDKSGYGNHIEVISLLADLGKLMAEDSPAIGRGGVEAQTKDAAEVLYGKS